MYCHLRRFRRGQKHVAEGARLPADAAAGELALDGRVLTNATAQRLFFLQSQEDILFNASVLQNITLFAPSSPGQQRQVEQALRSLGLADAVAQLPGA